MMSPLCNRRHPLRVVASVALPSACKAREQPKSVCLYLILYLSINYDQHRRIQYQCVRIQPRAIGLRIHRRSTKHHPTTMFHPTAASMSPQLACFSSPSESVPVRCLPFLCDTLKVPLEDPPRPRRSWENNHGVQPLTRPPILSEI